MFKKLKDPVSCLTHFLGALLAIPCAVLLIVEAAKYATAWHVVSFAVFGAALFLLYAASAIYHMLPISERASNILRRIDHMMIFVLIAGTYTPVCLIPLRGAWGWTLLILIWAIAIFGIVLKAVWLEAPRWLSTAIYVFMGWIVAVAFVPLIKAVSIGGIALLLSGGAVYTAGALIYAIKRPRLNLKWFGFHELFHLFVLGGSACHVLMMFCYLLPN